MGRRSSRVAQSESNYGSDEDLFGPEPVLNQEQHRAPRVSREERDQRRATRAESDRLQTNRATGRRRRWEKTPEGQTRQRDVVDFATEQHNKLASERPELGLQHRDRLSITHAQAYEHYGFGQAQSDPGMHEQQMPGLENPETLPQPKRWEEHTPKEQARIQKAVKRKTGATVDTMTHSFGAQLDQGYLRARSHGADKPYAQDFYTEGEPAQKMRETAKEHDVPFGLVAATVADTSPNMKFQHTYTGGERAGETVYPNVDAASHAIQHAQVQGLPEQISKEGMPSASRGVRPANLRKAAGRAAQVIQHGKSVSETFMDTGSGSGFGPKTAPFHNSWFSGTPASFVADLHSGGGGMLPHLGYAKPVKTNEEGDIVLSSEGRPYRHKAQREEGIATTGYHAMADYAARQAMGQRGLGHVRQAQAVQWGEEQLQRQEAGSRAADMPSEAMEKQRSAYKRRGGKEVKPQEWTAVDPKDAGRFPTAEQVYPKRHELNTEQFHGQGSLF